MIWLAIMVQQQLIEASKAKKLAAINQSKELEMKTIIDAVNVLRGDLGNSWGGDAPNHRFLFWNKRFGHFITDDNASDGGGRYQYICSIQEFNDMVAEMSEGFEEYKREYEMDKTVTVDGMVYEIGKLYEFSDCGKIWDAGCLLGTGNDGMFEGENEYWMKCRECQSQIGTVTPAPVELVDGKAYMFDFRELIGIVGIVDRKVKHGSEHVMFCTPLLNAEYNSEYATNITPLVPEVK